jgi:hypothetical protein
MSTANKERNECKLRKRQAAKNNTKKWKQLKQLIFHDPQQAMKKHIKQRWKNNK